MVSGIFIVDHAGPRARHAPAHLGRERTEVACHHFDGAVFNAFKAVEERVRNLTGNRKTKSGSPMRGKPLMSRIFDEQEPAHLIAAVDCGVVGRSVQVDRDNTSASSTYS
jgi:Protein of unknown function (Hypoth_ymh)